MHIYLDNNATTPVDQEVKEAVIDALDAYGNPSSGHFAGRKAKDVVDTGRAAVAALINASPGEIYFTSGGTESDNLAIMGTAYRFGRGHIITSSIEHPAVTNPVRHLEKSGYSATFIPVDNHGRVIVGELEKAIRKDTILITIMHSNNETGTIQPIEEIGLIARERGIAFHTDAAQSVGKTPIDVAALNADMLTIVSHKFYGPKGIGALYIRKGVEPLPIMYGAGHEKGIRPGTEAVPSIAGLGRACEIAMRDLRGRLVHFALLRKILIESLQREIPGLKLNGHPDYTLLNTLNLTLPGIDAVDFVDSLKDTVAFSSGSACHSGVRKPSSVLSAMGVPDSDALASIRLSAGKDNTEAGVIEAAALISGEYLLRGQGRSVRPPCPL